jgi:CRP-like cAMP-binding protein
MKIFQGLTPEEVGRIVDVGRVEYWQAEARVLEEGSQGPRLMVLLEGTVEVLRSDTSGTGRVIAQLGPGEILGEMSLLLDLPRTATVRALTALRVFAMDRTAFEKMVQSGDPAVLKLGLELSKMLALRVMRLNERVVHLLAASDAHEPLRQEFGQARQELFNLWE